jgi:predicted DCC family thiol-disulfide oxidoreductase YuxK
MPIERTTPPGRYIVLYDGLCKFCQAGMNKLLALARPGAIQPVSFQEPGALEPFPGITLDDCLREMYLITPAGRVYRGFEAAVQALATRRLLGCLAYIYYVPGIRQLLNWVYARIAANRYRLMGKVAAGGECKEGTCALHAQLPANPL